MFQRHHGKDYLAYIYRENALRQGKTVFVVTPDGTTKWRRVYRNGRPFDVIENVQQPADNK